MVVNGGDALSYPIISYHIRKEKEKKRLHVYEQLHGYISLNLIQGFSSLSINMSSDQISCYIVTCSVKWKSQQQFQFKYECIFDKKKSAYLNSYLTEIYFSGSNWK